MIEEKKLLTSSLVTSPYQTRLAASWSEDGILRLRESIRKDGLLEKILVRPVVEDWRKKNGEYHGRYEIISGHRRKDAIVSLGWREIDCRIDYSLSEYSAEQEQEVESKVFRIVGIPNAHSEPLDPLETGKYIKMAVDKGFARNIEEAGQILGLGRSSAYEYHDAWRSAESAFYRVMHVVDPDEDALRRFRSALNRETLPLLLSVKSDEGFGRCALLLMEMGPWATKENIPDHWARKEVIQEFRNQVEAANSGHDALHPDERPHEDTEKIREIIAPVEQVKEKAEQLREQAKEVEKIEDPKEKARAEKRLHEETLEALQKAAKVADKTAKQAAKNVAPVVPNQLKSFPCYHCGEEVEIDIVTDRNNGIGLIKVNPKSEKPIPVSFKL